MKAEFKHYKFLIEALGKLLYPFAEIVLHDLTNGKIKYILNSFSKREVGDLSYVDIKGLNFNEKNIIGPYEKINYDGRKLKSISIVIKDLRGKSSGLLCINLDISIFDKYKYILDTFLNQHNLEDENTKILFKDDLYEKIHIFIKNYCFQTKMDVNALTRSQKKSLILKLKQEGALNKKNGPIYVARILGISRATIYNYLKKLND
ncbi:MAG: PAS domain-containing protein [Rickettsiales bacterium]